MSAESLINIEEKVLHAYYGQHYPTYSNAQPTNIWGGLLPNTNYIIAWEHNSGEIIKRQIDDAFISHTPFNSTRQFIKLEQSFLRQLNSNDAFEGQNKYFLQEKMRISADTLLNCFPDKVSLEVTNEGSIFYTLIKDDLRIYFQHYLIDEFDDTEEALVSIFKGEDNLLNYGGTLTETLKELSRYLISQNIALPQLA
jgi:hypothetical protein